MELQHRSSEQGVLASAGAELSEVDTVTCEC